MRTKFTVNGSDGSHDGAAIIEVLPGFFDGRDLDPQEKEILAQFIGNALAAIFQLRKFNEQERRKQLDASERERRETGDEMSDVSLPSSGGNKVGIC